QLDDARSEGRLLPVLGHLVDERFVHLQDVDGKPTEVVERGVARAEVVDGQLDPDLFELIELEDGEVGVGHHRGLSDLEDERARASTPDTSPVASTITGW